MAATDLAEQATLAKDLGAVRSELRVLQSQATAIQALQDAQARSLARGPPLPILDRDDLEAGEAHEAPSCSPSECLSGPEVKDKTGNPSESLSGTEEKTYQVDLTYVVPTALRGKHGNTLGRIHTIDPVDTSRTLCGWYYERFNCSSAHIFSTTPFPSENVAIEGAVKCSTCTRCEEQRSL